MFNQIKAFPKNSECLYQCYACNGVYQQSFFQPFESLHDAKINIKALFFSPIFNMHQLLLNILSALIKIPLGLANMAIGIVTCDSNRARSFNDDRNRETEYQIGLRDFIIGVVGLIRAIYFAYSLIYDVINNFSRLVTHSIASIGDIISKQMQDNTPSVNLRR